MFSKPKAQTPSPAREAQMLSDIEDKRDQFMLSCAEGRKAQTLNETVTGTPHSLGMPPQLTMTLSVGSAVDPGMLVHG